MRSLFEAKRSRRGEKVLEHYQRDADFGVATVFSPKIGHVFFPDEEAVGGDARETLGRMALSWPGMCSQS